MDVTKKLCYEKALDIRYREADLLFQRFNYFVAGMSLVVAAWAVIITSQKLNHQVFISCAIAVLGVFLSLLFFLINCLAAKSMGDFDEYLIKAEEDTIWPPCNFPGPFQTMLDKTKRNYGCLAKWRALHTWLIPLLFSLFWVVAFVVAFWK